jgi:hypothetical protein
VSEPFENSMDFFYPTPYSRVLTLRDNQLADAVNAEVTLAEIPFVSLRHGLPAKLLSGNASFSQTVAAAQTALAAPELVIDLANRRIQASGQTIDLPPAELALLAVFARRAVKGEPALAAPPKGSRDSAWAKRYLHEYCAIVGSMGDLEATHAAFNIKPGETTVNGMDGEYFSQRKSKLEKRLKTALGPAARHYCIDDGGTRPRNYQLALPPEAVRFVADVAFREEIK